MKTITYTCPYVPAEWIAAHGFKPQRIIPNSNGSACSATQREGICPYVRSFINEAVTNEQTSAVIVTTLCDQMRRAYDVLKSDCPCPIFLMNVPSTWQTLSSQKLYIDETKRLSKFLIRLGGSEPTTDTLIKTMLDYDSARRALIRSKVNLTARQLAEAIADFNINRPEKTSKTELTSKPATTGIRLAIVGGPLMKKNFDILDLVENHGGIIVLNATETGERGLPGPFNRRNLNEDPFMELVNTYFTGIHDASRRPNSGFYQWLHKIIEDRDIQGIIFHRYIWCDIWHAEFQRLKDWLDIPVLEIDSTGDTESENNRTENRIHAFMEMFQ